MKSIKTEEGLPSLDRRLRRLFCQVMLQAVKDMARPDVNLRVQAHEWLTGPDPVMQGYCRLLNLPADKIAGQIAADYPIAIIRKQGMKNKKLKALLCRLDDETGESIFDSNIQENRKAS